MRSRFALLVAAAVIFAPGGHGHGRPQAPRGSDLAARVLAPTMDEGAIREAAADVKHQFGGRQAKRWRPPIAFEAVSAFGLGALGLVTFWLFSFHFGSLLVLLNRLSCRFSRAPPRLQPA
jgi:hypothetical protein